MRGGAWAEQHTGQVVDTVLAAASGTRVVSWSQQYGLPKQASFALKKYGEAPATGLAAYWCSKMQYLYNLWLDAGDAQYAFSHAAVAGVEETGELMDLFGDRSLKHLALQKLDELRHGLRPRPPT